MEKPVFVKISQIKPAHHCYNVYVRVVKATHSTITRLSGDILKIVEGVVADDSGCANFKFEGDHTTHIKEGATIAIRNGRSEVVDEHIRLETDRFGKISVEDAKTVSSANTKDNISAEAYQKKARAPAEGGRRGGERRDEEGGRGRPRRDDRDGGRDGGRDRERRDRDGGRRDRDRR